MSEVPSIFDQPLRRLRKRRASADFSAAAFLHERAAQEIAERLSAIHRSFRAFVCHGTPGLSQIVSTDAFATNIVESPQSICAFEETALPFAPQSLDAFASILTLHAVNDIPGALIQIRQSLRPDGLIIGAIFGTATLRELRDALAEAELECDGGVSPRIFPFADIRDTGALLQRAGFALPVTDADLVTVEYENPLKLLQDLRAMGETNVLHERKSRPLKRTTLLRAMEIYRERFPATANRVRATFELIYFAAWAPHPRQQQPLKPGSGKVSLADALKPKSD